MMCRNSKIILLCHRKTKEHYYVQFRMYYRQGGEQGSRKYTTNVFHQEFSTIIFENSGLRDSKFNLVVSIKKRIVLLNF